MDWTLKEPLRLHSTTNAEGELWVGFGDAPAQRLLADGRAYRVIPSPDGRLLAVETRLMFNLDVVRLFRRDGSRLLAVTPDATASAWRIAGQRHGFDPASLENTRTQVEGWSEDGRLLRLRLSATAADGPLPNMLIELPAPLSD